MTRTPNSEPVTFLHQVFVKQGGFDNYMLDYSNLTAEQTAGDAPKCRCST